MRHFISGLMILCLLHVTTSGAVAELSDSITPSHSAVSIPPDADSAHDVPTNFYHLIDHSPTNLKQIAQHSPNTETLAGLVIQVLFTCSSITIALGSSFFFSVIFCFSVSSGIPFSVAYTNLFGDLSAFAIPDQCINPSFMDAASTAELQMYQHITQGVLPLTSAILAWLNNDGKLLSMLGGLALGLRHDDHVHTADYQSVQERVVKLLKASGLPYIKSNVSCDLILGDPNQPDTFVDCHESESEEDSLPTTPGAHATLHIAYIPHHRFDSASVQLVALPAPDTQQFPDPDFSWNYGNVVPEIRTEARRMLLQFQNTLPLKDALRTWLTHADHWQTLAAENANLLRSRRCPSVHQSQELEDLTRSIFDANQARLTNGSMRCELNFVNDRLTVSQCDYAKLPSYDHSMSCSTFAAHMISDAAVWFIPGDGKTSYKYSLLQANNAAEQESLTPTYEEFIATLSQSKTMGVTDSLSSSHSASTSLTLKKPETPAPTTLATTLAPTTQVPTTPPTTLIPTTSAPVRNTTTRIYWASPPSKIYVAEINTTSWTPMNSRIFYQGDPQFQPRKISIDTKNNKIYWASPSQGIFVGNMVPDASTTVQNITKILALNWESPAGVQIDPENQRLYWQDNYDVYYATINTTHPQIIGNISKLTISYLYRTYRFIMEPKDSLFYQVVNSIYVSNYTLENNTLSNTRPFCQGDSVYEFILTPIKNKIIYQGGISKILNIGDIDDRLHYLKTSQTFMTVPESEPIISFILVENN